nr:MULTISPECIES: ATP-binding cassette domain-containing protein [unclassified Enterococcus]
MAIPIPKFRRIGNGKELTITNIKELNLKNICVSLPLGKFIAITGVSGSGKSTLVNKVIGGAIANSLYNSKRIVGKFDEIIGMEEIKDLVRIDQAPIGKNNRSNLATYCGLFDNIRTLFSKTNAAKVRGYQARRFSYNVKGGRCETCEGEGIKKVDMSLLPDIFIICDVCHGKQFNSETLEVQYKGKNIAEVLKMSVSEALIFFQTYPSIKRKLEVFEKIGLGYLQLGQPASTLSGGEAQRIKLGTELAKVKKKGALYILDEPTNGLNITDIQKLIDVLQNLVDKGNTVLVIEHKMDLIKTVDHIIDLGPEGGEKGGHIISAGTPEEVAASANSVTGYYLKNYL